VRTSSRSGTGEHDDAVAAARSHLDQRSAEAPLRALPEDFESSRADLHRVAEHVLKPKRELETGNEIALCFTPGGFGSPPWERGRSSGTSGQIRVEGTELVLRHDGEERRAEVGNLQAEAELIGAESAGVEAGEGIAVDPDAAAAIADWVAFGTVVLAELIESHPDADPEPIRLWPEHFDVATVLGSEDDGARANYGASPGDEDHPEPYLYVGPWVEQSGELWNARACPGAELGHS
jgi:hypothetical protein